MWPWARPSPIRPKIRRTPWSMGGMDLVEQAATAVVRALRGAVRRAWRALDGCADLQPAKFVVHAPTV